MENVANTELDHTKNRAMFANVSEFAYFQINCSRSRLTLKILEFQCYYTNNNNFLVLKICKSSEWFQGDYIIKLKKLIPRIFIYRSGDGDDLVIFESDMVMKFLYLSAV